MLYAPPRIRQLALLTIFTGLGSWPAAAFQPPRYGGTITAPLPSRPVTLDPSRMERLGDWQVALLLYDTLFTLRRQGSPSVPHLALGLRRLGASRRRVVITLRSGVRSHRGRLLTSAQVVSSLGRLRAGPMGWLLATVTSLRARGPHQVVLRLRRSCPELEQVLSAPPTSILPGPPGASRPDGTGPFQLVRSRSGGPFVLSAHTYHFAGRPYLDRIHLVPYRRPQDEVSAFSLRQALISLRGRLLFGRKPPFPTRTLRSPAITSLMLLVGDRGPGRVRKVRRAIYLAVNKRRLRHLVTDAPTRPAHGPVPPVLLGRRVRSPAPYRPVEARRLLAAASVDPRVAASRGPDGRPQVTLLVDRSRQRDLDAARKIMADLRAVGLRAVISPRRPGSLVSTVQSGSFELALWHVTSPVLRSRYHLAAVYAAARRPRRARKIIRSLRTHLTARLRRFMRELPAIPLFHHGIRAYLDRDRAALTLGPWGLVRWADVSLLPRRRGRRR